MTLDDEDTFCSLDTLTQVLNCKVIYCLSFSVGLLFNCSLGIEQIFLQQKSIFDNLENREMMNGWWKKTIAKKSLSIDSNKIG